MIKKNCDRECTYCHEKVTISTNQRAALLNKKIENNKEAHIFCDQNCRNKYWQQYAKDKVFERKQLNLFGDENDHTSRTL